MSDDEQVIGLAGERAGARPPVMKTGPGPGAEAMCGAGRIQMKPWERRGDGDAFPQRCRQAPSPVTL